MTLAQAQANIRDTVSSVTNQAAAGDGLNDPGRVDFLIILIGVIVGLSIGRLVNFVGECLVHRKNLVPSLTQGIFLLALFLYQIFYWWDMWELKALLKSDGITFLIFARLLLIPLCLFCATALLCPQLKFPEGGEKLSMAEHFFEQSKPVYFIWLLICLIAMSQAAAIRAEGWGSMEVYIRLSAAGLFFIGLFIRNQLFNLVLGLVLLAMLIVFIFISVT